MRHAPLFTRIARWQYLGALSGLLIAACTPFHDKYTSKNAHGGAGGAKAAEEQAQAGAAGTAAPSVAQASLPCSVEGARACSSDAGRAVLICREATWQMDTACVGSERCDSEGRCRPAEAACVGRAPAQPFCDGDIMRVCQDAFSARTMPCAPQQRCIMMDERAICSCVPGTIDMGKGCQPATSCAREGGCDPLTTCSMEKDKRVCSACPAGYDGDGLTGCSPRLLALHASCRDAQISSENREYRVRVSTLCQQLSLGFEVAADVRVEVEGQQLPAGEAWESGPIPVGERTAQVRLTAGSGTTRSYAVTLERHANQDAYIKASNPGGGDCFGFNLAASGGTLLTGAPFEDSSAGGVNGDQSSDGAADSGAAYVYARQGNAWVQQGYLKADVPAAGSFFGTSVAVDGDTLVVGAPGQDPRRFNATRTANAGAAYVYVRKDGAWSPDTKLLPTGGAADDLFGFKVAVQGDRVFVTAPHDDEGGVDSGATYVFARNAGKWSEPAKIKAAKPIANSNFGFAIAVDGDSVLVGASLDPSATAGGGSAYVFVLRDQVWREQQRLVAPKPRMQDTFGWQVALQGNTAIVSAPVVDLARMIMLPGQVFVFERERDHWSQDAMLQAPSPRAGDLYGSAVSLFGSTLVVGGNGTNELAGAAYLYVHDAGSWSLTTELKTASLDKGDGLGQVAAVTDEAILIGAPFEDSAAKGINGDATANSAADSGATYVFR